MKQKIMIKVPMMNGLQDRRKVLRIATKIGDVELLAIEGKEKDELVVVGTGVDVIKLLQMLRKKLKLCANIISITEVKEKKEGKEGKEAKSAEAKAPSAASGAIYYHYPPYPQYNNMAYDPVPNTCSIL